MNDYFLIRPMQAHDVDAIIQTFGPLNKTHEQFRRYWQENVEQKRQTLLAWSGNRVVGYSNIVWESSYAPFNEQGIPEINDMHVIDDWHGRGIGTAFIKQLERIAIEHGKDIMGIGFGLTPDYGNAQRLYPRLGYIPDGRGAIASPYGDELFLTKRLYPQGQPPLTYVPSFPIETERLHLRPFALSDIDAVLAYHALPEVVRYMYWQPRNRAEVQNVLRDRLSMTKLMVESDRLNLAVVLKDSDTLIGEVVLMYRSAEHQQCELGFAFNPQYHGQGYASEAARAMLKIGFEGYAMHRIYGQLDARNTPSAHVLSRIGMRREAHFVGNELFKGEWGEELVYAILRSEWLTHSHDDPTTSRHIHPKRSTAA